MNVTTAHQNHLIAALSKDEHDHVLSLSEVVELAAGTVLYEDDQEIVRVYFPLNCVLSSICIFESGHSAEMATIGCEGMLSVTAVLGTMRVIGRNIVQVPGACLVMSINAFQQAQEALPAFREVVNAYAHALLGQIMQTVACNALHSGEQRCAKWLLMTDDRANGEPFQLKQEFLAAMLGVNRITVSGIANSLQQTGLISYSRGTISVLDRAGLEEVSCDCYPRIRKRFTP
ncbi:Crp/Fnr family transcriptional regulator [Methylobacterium longum]|uniref:Crp/Fnr family transcriptional regulator n=1 Tax=Methylobacterium longum TaxID=767694 RepID=A0ABT8AL15_9HYPH|nr:Crp/Fnr family transcriptional regulator [Methylobacterium longum]MDN3570510.1 Crp/Fnr family transcriptional regulator [Methylobacterium longum]